MKKLAAFILVFISLNVAAQNEAAEDTASTPVITKVGQPAGKKTEMKVTKEGGSLRSSDGLAELVFLPGTVSKKTDISIQPITSLIANGQGKAYRLEPSGMLFQKPVQLIFHYDEEETKDSMQLLLGIAMQDDKGLWHSLDNAEVDTLTKTISGQISHFSDWGKFDAIKLYPSRARLKVKKTLDLMIDLVSSEEEEIASLTMPAGLSPLKKMKIPWKATWRANEIINGNASVGKIVQQSRNTATYTAPATVPSRNPVAVSADLNGLSYKAKVKGRLLILNDLKLVSNILIFDDAYEVTMISEIQHPGIGSNLGAVTYKDTGSFVLSLNGKEARIIEKVNKNISASLDYAGGCCYNYKILKPGTGNIHIAGIPVIKVTPPSAPGKSAIIEISFTRVPAILPLLQVTCKCPGDKSPTTSTNASGVAMMAGILAAFPQQMKFEAKEGEQIILEHGKPGSELYAKFTVKQLKED